MQRRHDNVMRLLVRRFITAEQRKRDDFGVTEDDVMEIRQDISTLRYELIDIFHKNGMKTPRVDSKENQRKQWHFHNLQLNRNFISVISQWPAKRAE